MWSQDRGQGLQEELTLRRRKMRRWCPLESTGKPFLLVRKMEVGKMAALTGSPSQRSMT